VTPFPQASSASILQGVSTNPLQLAPQPGSLRPSGRAAEHAGQDHRIRVLIADDHPAVRVGIRRLLVEQPDMRIVTEAKSAVGAVTGTAASPQVAVIDYHLGDRNGLWVTRRLRQLVRPPRVLIYSAFTDDAALAIAAVVAGADGLLSKSSIGEELCVAIRRLAAGHRYLPSISASVTRAMSARLDPRQQTIVAMLVHGISPEQITARLPITTQQLETQQSAILAMLAPAATRARQPTWTRKPLDYQRASRSSRLRLGSRTRS
jgi:DNA-binding NarL/FixJ family response regulator